MTRIHTVNTRGQGIEDPWSMKAHVHSLFLFLLCFVLIASAAVPKNIFGQRARTIVKLKSCFEDMKSVYEQGEVLEFLKAMEEFEDANAEMASLCHKGLPVVRDLTCIDKNRLDRNVASFYTGAKTTLLKDTRWKRAQMIQYLSDLNVQFENIESIIKQAEKFRGRPKQAMHEAIVEMVMEPIHDVVPEFKISLKMAIKEASSYVDGLYRFRQVAQLESIEVAQFLFIETVYSEGVAQLRQFQKKLDQVYQRLMATLADLGAINYR